jgi:hypothetical protein
MQKASGQPSAPRGPGIVAAQPAAQEVLRANTALHIVNEILR